MFRKSNFHLVCTQQVLATLRACWRMPGLVVLFGFFLVSPGKARADLATQFGLSPRGIGMANAGSAVIDDYAAVFYNPAGLALSPASSFTFGYFYTSPRVRSRDPGGKEHLLFTSHMNVPVIGYRQNLRNVFPDKWGKNIVVALAVASSDNLKTGTLVETYLYEDRQLPVFGRVQDMLVMSGGFGVELTRWLLLGVGMRFAATYDATNITATMNLVTGETVVEKLEVNADTEMQPIAGILFRPWEAFRVAGVWRRGGSPIKLVGSGGGRAVIGPLVLPMSLSLAFRDFFTPDEFTGSVAYSVTERLLLAFELTYARWSNYDVPFGQKPPGEPFRDIILPRFGAEYVFSEQFKFQMGYYWQPSPVKSFQPYTHYLDNDQHVFSAAAEYAWLIKGILKHPLRFRFYFQYQHLPRRTLDTINGPTDIWGYITNLGGTVEIRFR